MNLLYDSVYLEEAVIVATIIPMISICLLVILATIVVFALWKHRKVCFTYQSTATHTSEHAPSSSAAAVELQRYEYKSKRKIKVLYLALWNVLIAWILQIRN